MYDGPSNEELEDDYYFKLGYEIPPEVEAEERKQVEAEEAEEAEEVY